MINFAANSGYSIVIPLYPPLAKDKGISDSVIGYIFCLYPVGGFIVTIVLGSVMTVQSMKKVLIISMKIMLVGLILTIIGMAGIGTVNYIEDTIPFAIVSAAMRLISGIVFCIN
jgi:predicted MFS family arabinose efflux permease